MRYFSVYFCGEDPIVSLIGRSTVIYGVIVIFVTLFLGCSKKEVDEKGLKLNREVKVEDDLIESSVKIASSSLTSDESETESVDFDEMEIEEVLNYADSHLSVSNWIAAKPALEYLLDDDTEPLEYHYKMGKVLFELGDYARAMDHLLYTLESSDLEGLSFKKSAEDYVLRGKSKALELASLMHGIKDANEERADLVFKVFKLYPDIDLQKEVKLPVGVEKSRRKIYYIVTAMESFSKRLEHEKTFWNYYHWGYLNFLQKWYADARKAIEKAILFADSHALIFYALRMEEKIEKIAPVEASSELDKFAVLDLNEDVLDSFLEKYQKDLSEKQIQKAREVIRMGMKLKSKLERASSDQEKLKVLRKFKDLSEEMLKGEDFPPDIKGKIKKGTAKAEKRLLDLEEQIRIKLDALNG